MKIDLDRDRQALLQRGYHVLNIRELSTEHVVLLLKWHDELVRRGFTVAQLSYLLDLNQKDFQSIRALFEYSEGLLNHTFSIHQIINMVSYCNGGTNLQAVHDHYITLHQQGFSIAQIVKMATNQRGFQNLLTASRYLKKLCQAGFTMDQVVCMASFDSGSSNLISVNRHFKMLEQHGFSVDQMTSMASVNGGGKTLEKIVRCFNVLYQTHGFSKEGIVMMASHIGSSRTLEAVIKYSAALQAVGVTKGTIVKAASRNLGHRMIATLMEKRGVSKALPLVHEHPGAVESASKRRRGSGFFKSEAPALASLPEEGVEGMKEDLMPLPSWNEAMVTNDAIWDSTGIPEICSNKEQSTLLGSTAESSELAVPTDPAVKLREVVPREFQQSSVFPMETPGDVLDSKLEIVPEGILSPMSLDFFGELMKYGERVWLLDDALTELDGGSSIVLRN